MPLRGQRLFGKQQEPNAKADARQTEKEKAFPTAMEERMSTENFPRLHGPDCEQSTDQRKWRFFMMNHCHLDFSNRFFCLAFFSKISFCIAYYDNQ